MKTIVIAMALAAVALPVSAHHSAAMFDDKKEVTLTGTVKEFQYTRRFGHPTLIGAVKSLDEMIESLAQ